MVLKDIWAENRSQRLSEIAQRRRNTAEWREKIHGERQVVRQDLQIQAEELHQDLEAFRNRLERQTKQGQQQRKREIANRQERILQLRQRVNQRQQQYREQLNINSKNLFAQLDNFHSQLRYSVWGEEPNKAQPKTEAVKKNSEANFEEKSLKSQVYQYAKDIEGVSLVDIEQKIGISRKHTIHLVRALIQEGLLEQRERNYFAL